ncbi:CorA family divalent cation transporter [Streptomyces yangpuensis]|uniref:CorA family divalent cation transporter n=1 Tax=Streptomyces yangpuensis TaxID=1648182 RepID=UPI0036495FDE
MPERPDRRPSPPSAARRSGWRRTASPAAAPPSAPAPAPAAPVPPPPDHRSVIDSAVYRDGHRIASPATLAETFRQLREEPDGMAWIGLHRPTESELHSLAAEFNLHELAVEDALEAHQRPKLERYGDTLFVVLRAARYLDAQEEVEFAELHIFVGPDFLITVRHGSAPDLSAVRRRMEANPDLLSLGPEAAPRPRCRHREPGAHDRHRGHTLPRPRCPGLESPLSARFTVTDPASGIVRRLTAEDVALCICGQCGVVDPAGAGLDGPAEDVPVLRPVTLAPREDLVAAVRGVPLFNAALRLTAWCREGLQVTAGRVLRPALAREAVEELQLWKPTGDDSPYADAGTRARALKSLRSATDMAVLGDPWWLAVDGGLITISGGRAWGGAATDFTGEGLMEFWAATMGDLLESIGETGVQPPLL